MKIHPISRSELWLVQIVLVFAILLQFFAWNVSAELSSGPNGLIMITEFTLLAVISLTADRRHLLTNSLYRNLSFILLGIVTLANITSFYSVTKLLLAGGQVYSGKDLIVSALAIFLTNIIVFSLWYWEIDSPGLTGHKWTKHNRYFQFDQQSMTKDFPNWQPSYVDYLYESVTNAINFAPGSARPITPWAKLLMGTQALLSAFTLALIIARSINLLN